MAQEEGPPKQPVRPDWMYGAPDNTREAARPAASEETARLTGQFEHSLLVLMERTGDSPELSSAIDSFVRALGNRAYFGSLDEPFSEGQQRDLTAFFTNATERLRPSGTTGWHIAKE